MTYPDTFILLPLLLREEETDMSDLHVPDLPPNIKAMCDSEEKWRDKALQGTIAAHKEDIEKLLEKANLFDIWSNQLQDSDAAKRLIPEIFMDAYTSIHFACYGLYKYAHICLRTQLETSLRLIYFSTHTVEFQWWLVGNEWYRAGLRTREVWGEGYGYFEQLPRIKRFEEICDEANRLFQNARKVPKIYQTLSTYVHSGVFSFQTKSDLFSPTYRIEEFYKWHGNFAEVQSYINILLALAFEDRFCKMTKANKEKIINIGVESVYHQELIKNISGL